jgi:hypothetical protein
VIESMNLQCYTEGLEVLQESSLKHNVRDIMLVKHTTFRSSIIMSSPRCERRE